MRYIAALIAGILIGGLAMLAIEAKAATVVNSFTAPLIPAYGGTGLGSYTGNRMLYTNNAGTTLLQIASSTIFRIGTGGQILTWANGEPQWVASTTYANGTGISTSFSSGQLTITNTAPDQTVVLSAGDGISIASAYPTFTIGNPFAVATVTSPSLAISQLSYFNKTSGKTTLAGVGTTSATINNGLTGTLTTINSQTQTIGLAQINAGVLGSPVDTAIPTSQATSTLYGLGQNGFVLAEVAGIPTWVATSTLSTISGQLALGSQVSGDLPFANLTQGAANTVLVNQTSATADFAALATSTFANGLYVGSAGQVLYRTSAGTWTGTATTTFSSGLTYSNGNVTADLGTSITPGELSAAITGNQIPYANNAGTAFVGAASSTLYGSGTGGQVLTWNNGQPQWIGTTTAGTGLTYNAGSPGNFSVNASQSISTLSNLTNNGFVITTGSTGALSIQTLPCTIAQGCTAATSFTPYGLIVANSLGTALAATSTNPLYVDAIIATSTLKASGFGSTTPIGYLSINPTAGVTSNLFVIGSSSQTQLQLDTKTHFGLGGFTPTIGTCGTSPTITGSDNAGKAVAGTGSINACTITFARSYTVAPACTFSISTTIATSTIYDEQVSTSALIIRSSASNMGGSTINYLCDGIAPGN